MDRNLTACRRTGLDAVGMMTPAAANCARNSDRQIAVAFVLRKNSFFFPATRGRVHIDRQVCSVVNSSDAIRIISSSADSARRGDRQRA